MPSVRLIDENETMVGVVGIEEARERAESAGLDLVEIAPDSDPPVCKIVDFGRYKYELSKRERANKAKTKGYDMKEVRLGRSMKIDPHDVAIRLNQARKFLIEGHKVQIVQNFKGREMVHKHRGMERMQGIIEQLGDISKLETPPRQYGRRMTMILAPDKIKIDQLKKKLASQKAVTETPPPKASTAKATAPEKPASKVAAQKSPSPEVVLPVSPAPPAPPAPPASPAPTEISAEQA